MDVDAGAPPRLAGVIRRRYFFDLYASIVQYARWVKFLASEQGVSVNIMFCQYNVSIVRLWSLLPVFGFRDNVFS